MDKGCSNYEHQQLHQITEYGLLSIRQALVVSEISNYSAYDYWLTWAQTFLSLHPRLWVQCHMPSMPHYIAVGST